MPWVVAGVFVLGGIIGAKLTGDLEEATKSVGGVMLIGAAAGVGGVWIARKVLK